MYAMYARNVYYHVYIFFKSADKLVWNPNCKAFDRENHYLLVRKLDYIITYIYSIYLYTFQTNGVFFSTNKCALY